MDNNGEKFNNNQFISYHNCYNGTYFDGIPFPANYELTPITISPDDLDPIAENGVRPSSNGFVVSSAQPGWMPSPVHGGGCSSNSSVAVSSVQPAWMPSPVHGGVCSSNSSVAVPSVQPAWMPSPVHGGVCSSNSSVAVLSVQPAWMPSPVHGGVCSSNSSVAVPSVQPAWMPSPEHGGVCSSNSSVAVPSVQPAWMPSPVYGGVCSSNSSVAVPSVKPAWMPSPVHGGVCSSNSSVAVPSVQPAWMPSPVHGGVCSSNSSVAVPSVQPAWMPSPVHGGAGSSSSGIAVSSVQSEWMPSPVHGGAGSSSSGIAVSSVQSEWMPSPVHGGAGSSSSGIAVSSVQSEWMTSPVHGRAGSSSSGISVSSVQSEWMPPPIHSGASSSNNNVAVPSSHSVERPPVQPSPGPSVMIIEQPTPLVRFRYKPENRGGPIPGICSTPDRPTYPTISIHNHVGPALVVVSCVTADRPYKVHPHNLFLGNNSNNDSIDGIVAVKQMIKRNNNVVELKKIKIQCVKWPEVQDGMQRRKHVRVPELHALEIDPFRQGFDYCRNRQSIDLNKVRLAFQVFVRQNDKESWNALGPVVSETISKAPGVPGQGPSSCSSMVPDIKCASHDSGTTTGGTKMIILLSVMIDINDMNVVFYERDDTKKTVWTAVATMELVFTDNIAIVFKTPPYSGHSLDDRISVYFYLYKRSLNQCSRSLPFNYISEFRVSERSSKDKSKTIKVRVRRAAPNFEEVGTATTTKEKTKAGDSDKALNDSLAQLSIKF